MRNPYFQLLASTAYHIDRKTREDLVQNFLVSEPDYVSNLTKGIRDAWQFLGLPALAHSQVLSRRQENIFGCDAVILIRMDSTAKLCLFEAKYPKLSQSYTYRWDKLQGKLNVSHFSNQLERQYKWSHIAAVFEFFILEYPPGEAPKNFDLFASTCIWHLPVFQYDQTVRNSSQPWNSLDLHKLLSPKTKKQIFSARNLNLYKILMQVCKCENGIRLPIQNGIVNMRSSDEESIIRVPASFENIETNISEFCEEYQISNFIYIELPRLRE